MDTATKGKDYTLIQKSEGKEYNCVGHYGLGIRNTRGNKVIERCTVKDDKCI